MYIYINWHRNDCANPEIYTCSTYNMPEFFGSCMLDQITFRILCLYSL